MNILAPSILSADFCELGNDIDKVKTLLLTGKQVYVSLAPSWAGVYNFSKEKGGAYYEVSGTEWYYEGQFWSEMPDMNLASEAVRAEFESIVDYWLELGVDGFRLDAIKEFYTGADSKNIEVLTWFNDMVTAKKEDVFIDCLTLTASTEQKYPANTIMRLCNFQSFCNLPFLNG